MIYAAFNIAFWTIVFFIVGMIKPKWPLFFLKQPDRFLVIIISIVLVMISLTLYGEGNRQKQLEQQKTTQVSEDTAPVVDAVPTITPTPAPESVANVEVVPEAETVPAIKDSPNPESVSAEKPAAGK